MFIMKSPRETGSHPNFTHLAEFEAWASKNWLHQHGTIDAQMHARAKLDEEIIEFRDALTDGNAHDIISEGGDILWTAHASGANTSITPSAALAYTYPALFTEQAIPTGHLDQVATAVYEGLSEDEYASALTRNGNAVFKYTKQWFNLRDIVANHEPVNFTEALVWTKHHRASIALARLVLLVSYGLQTHTDTGLGAAMDDNYQKIEARIESGAPVTKSPRRSVRG